MMSRNVAFIGVWLLIAIQVQGFEYLENVIRRASINLRLLESGVDSGKPVYYSNGVALDLGNLNKETFPSLHENLRIAIAGSHKLFLSVNGKKYDDVLSSMMQNPLTQPKEESFINRMDKFLPEKKAWWNFLGKSQETKRKELNEWFQKLITDNDFLQTTRLDSKSSTSMAKTSMLFFDDLRDKCDDKDEGTVQRDIIDLCVLQYPQTQNATFLLHRVHLFGWVDCGTFRKNGGVTGEYVKREFMPRYTIISQLKPASREKALGYIDTIFESIEPKNETTTTGSTTTDEPTKASSSSIKPDVLLTSTTAAITTVASITKSPDDKHDDDEDIC